MKRILLLTAIAAMTMAGSAAYAQEAVYDPIEPVNRAVLGFNNAVDTVILDPVVVGYRAVAPKPVRTGLRNFVRHLESPLYFANNLLQGDVTGATTTLKRAVINTFVGFGGVWDVAAEHGINEDAEDFGQTLAVWGVGDGPYLVLPLLGPSNLRDTGGLIVDSFADPINQYARNTDQEEIMYARTAAKVVTVKNDVYDAQKDMKANSADYYAALRSAAKQRRDAVINDSISNSGTGNSALPDYNIE